MVRERGRVKRDLKFENLGDWKDGGALNRKKGDEEEGWVSGER